MFVTKRLLLPFKLFFLSGAWKLSRFRKTLLNRLNLFNSSQSSFFLKELKFESNWRESSELK